MRLDQGEQSTNIEDRRGSGSRQDSRPVSLFIPSP